LASVRTFRVEALGFESCNMADGFGSSSIVILNKGGQRVQTEVESMFADSNTRCFGAIFRPSANLIFVSFVVKGSELVKVLSFVKFMLKFENVLRGKSSSIYPNSRILIDTPWLTALADKMI
jgi:hypothetical protein